LIVGVKSGRHPRQARHEAIDRRLAVISAFEKPLDLVASAHDKASVVSFDQPRMA